MYMHIPASLISGYTLSLYYSLNPSCSFHGTFSELSTIHAIIPKFLLKESMPDPDKILLFSADF